MAVAENSAPLHSQVRANIERLIESGAYGLDEALPSTNELAKEFAVSVITVKRAIQDLKSAGTVTSIPGKGIYANPNRRFVRNLFDFATTVKDGAHAGHKMSVTHIAASVEEIVERSLIEDLDAPKGSRLCIKKIVVADSKTIMIDRVFIPVDTSPEVLERCKVGVIGEAFGAIGIDLLHSDVIIEAAPVSNFARSELSLPVSYPVLKRCYRIHTSDPGVVLYGVVESPFDRLALSISIPRRDPTDYTT